jgi:hypothetical protein
MPTSHPKSDSWNKLFSKLLCIMGDPVEGKCITVYTIPTPMCCRYDADFTK